MFRPVLAVCLLLATLASAGDPTCGYDWLHRAEDDACYRVFPNNHQNTSAKVRLTFRESRDYCATHGAVLPVMSNSSLIKFLSTLVGRKTGEAIWSGVHADMSVKDLPQVWRTDNGRLYDGLFEWDKYQDMPQYEACVALHMAGDPANRVVGGNNKMITISCLERLSLVCRKERVPVHIKGVNMTDNAVLTHVWHDPNPMVLQIIGGRIPHGTRVTLQTTTPADFATGPNVPTNCTKIQPLIGASESYALNITAKNFHNGICNGTCDVATVTIDASAPFVRGAKYSLCFFVPIPFSHPNEPSEYANNLIPGVTVEIIQKHSEYLQDVCTRHQHSVQLFFGAGHLDTQRDKVNPFYFNSRHE